MSSQSLSETDVDNTFVNYNDPQPREPPQKT